LEALLKLRSVYKSFGGVVTADNVSMDVFPGEVHGLIGPNGAGKTTLLNLISGIYTVDDGKIHFGDTEVTHMASYDRAKLGLARTFQSPRFLQRSSIRDNLLLGTDLADHLGYVKSFFGVKGTDLNKELKELMDIAGFTFDWDEDIASLKLYVQCLPNRRLCWWMSRPRDSTTRKLKMQWH